MERVDSDSMAALREMLRKNDAEAGLQESERQDQLRDRLNELDRKARSISNRYHRSVVELVKDLLEEQERVQQQLQKLAPWNHPQEFIEDDAMRMSDRFEDLDRVIKLFEDEMKTFDSNRPKRNRPTSEEIRRRRDMVRVLSVDPYPMSHRDICRELDDHGFPVPASDQWRESGYKSWLKGYEDSRRGSIDKTFSGYNRKANVHVLRCGRLDLNGVRLPDDLTDQGVRTWSEGYLHPDLKKKIEVVTLTDVGELGVFEEE